MEIISDSETTATAQAAESGKQAEAQFAMVPRVLVGASTKNMSFWDGYTGTIEHYRTFLEYGGYHDEAGFSLTPVKYEAARATALELAAKGLISSLQEPTREARLRDIFTQPGGVSGFAATAGDIATFPMLGRSYGAIMKIQKAHRKGEEAAAKTDQEWRHPGALPIIINDESQLLRYSDLASEIWFQPTPDWANAHDIPLDCHDAEETAAMIVDAHRKAGIGGMVINLRELSAERSGHVFEKPLSLAAALARQVTAREVRLSMGNDFANDDQELRRACLGELDTTWCGEVLTAINETLPKDEIIRVVTEVKRSDLNRARRRDVRVFEAHANITGAVKRILSVKRPK